MILPLLLLSAPSLGQLGGRPQDGPTSMGGPGDGAYGKSGGGPVERSEDLSCDFEAPNDCCWTNPKPPADTYDFYTAKGLSPTQQSLWKEKMGPNPPATTFMTFGKQGGGAEETVMFQSCFIQCSASNIKVSLKHWRSNAEIRLAACLLRRGEVGSCAEVQEEEEPESTLEITAPVDEPTHVVLVASGMSALDGDLIAVDDIRVDFTPCGEEEYGTDDYEDIPPPTKEPETRPPEVDEEADVAAADVLACGALGAGAPGAMGDWRVGGDATEPWAPRDGTRTFQNRITGVRPLTESTNTEGYGGSPDFLATFLEQDQSCTLSVGGFFLKESRLLDLMIYRATADMAVELCAGFDCVQLVDPGRVSRDARSWVRKAVELESGTKELVLRVTNSAKNVGAVGLTNVFLTTLEGDDVCDTSPTF